MKAIKLRQSAERFQAEINAAIELSYGFLTARYGWKFDDVELTFSADRNTSVYYPGIKGQPQGWAKIKIRYKVFLYDRKKVNIKYQHNGFCVGYVLGTAMAIVHELTHHIQHVEGRKFSEVETTQNEVDFLMQHDVESFNIFLKKTA